jgi:hypothetical protein
MNVLSCLRLTARCADTLIYVQRDIFPYAQELELLAPIRKLEEYAFRVFLLQPTSHWHISSLGLLKISIVS